jgi:pimeloyl-ACP methyl ester carboxylesterase
VVKTISLNGVRIEMMERGAGPPLLFLHPEIGIDSDAAVLDLLAARTRVIVPTHPGFGGSEAPRSFDSVDDLAYFYLDLLDELDLKDVALVGVSLGGWIAAELAIKSAKRISHLILGNPVGIKVAGREHRDIADMFAMTETDFLEIAYHEPAAGRRDYKAMPEEEVRNAARNREATARYAWSPFMHDPKLKGRLHRIRLPTLFLWGSSDRVTNEDYGHAYCAAIPGARFERIERAGHFPHLERPSEFAEKIFAFIGANDGKQC